MVMREFFFRLPFDHMFVTRMSKSRAGYFSFLSNLLFFVFLAAMLSPVTLMGRNRDTYLMDLILKSLLVVGLGFVSNLVSRPSLLYDQIIKRVHIHLSRFFALRPKKRRK